MKKECKINSFSPLTLIMSDFKGKIILNLHHRIVVGFTTTCAISAYHHSSCEFESYSWGGEILLKVALNTINQTNQTKPTSGFVDKACF